MPSYESWGGGGPPSKKPDVDPTELWRNNRNQVLGILAAVVIGIGGYSSFYTVEAEEEGVVVRFGKFVNTTEPGLHFKLPFGIDEVYTVPVQRQLKMEFGFRTVSAGVDSTFRSVPAEAKMLSGDRNVGTVEWIIQYKIDDSYKYLFKFREIDDTLRLMAEATMRSVIGDRSINEIITGGREEIEVAAKERLQELNKLYDTGIRIEQLKLQDANVPKVVKPALREVEEAKQERESTINKAEAEYNKTVPRARGQAQQQIASAEGYKIARLNEAQGDAERFRALYLEYRKAPQVTRTRLYLEAMSEILPKVRRKVLLDKDAQGLVPFLNLQNGGGR